MTTSRDPRRDPRLLSRIVQPPGLPVPKPVMAGAAVRHLGPIQVQVTGLDDNWTNYLAAELEQKAIQLGPNRVSFRKDAVLDPKTSHLVVGRLRRTEKLLSAIASGRPNIVMADSILSSSLLDKAVILAADVGDRKCQDGRLQQPIFVPTRAERDGWAKSGGFFARDTVVILLTDSETKAKVRRILEAGGATVLPRTINHLVDNFDSAVTMIVTEPKLFEDTGAGMMGHPRRYSQLADICQKRRVHLVSLAYIEVALTSPPSAQTVSKKQFSVLRSEMVRYHQQIVSAVRSQPVHDRKRCGSPPLFTRGCSAGAAGHAAATVVTSPFAKPPAASSSRSKSAASSNGNRACDIVGSWIPASEYFNLTGVGGSLTNNNNNSCALLEGGGGSIFRPDYDSADERGDDAMYSHLKEISAEQDEADNLMAVVEKERGEPFDLAMIPIPTAEPSSGNSRASRRGDWGSLTGHQQLEQRPTQSGDNARTIPALVTRQTADGVNGVGGGRHQGSSAYPPLPVPVPVTDQSSHQPFVLPLSPVPVQPPLPPEENVPPTRGSDQEGPISFSLTGSVGSKRSATNKLPTFDELIVNSFAAVKKKKEASKERRTETSPRKEAGSSRHSWSLGTSENCAEIEEVTDRQSRVDKSSRSSSSSFVDKYFQTLDTAADKSRDRDYERSSRRDRNSGGSSSSRRDRHEGSSRHDRHHDGGSRKYDRHDSSSRHDRHLEGSRRRRSSKGDESPVKEKRRKDRRGSDVQLVDLCDSD